MTNRVGTPEEGVPLNFARRFVAQFRLSSEGDQGNADSGKRGEFIPAEHETMELKGDELGPWVSGIMERPERVGDFLKAYGLKPPLQ